MVCFYGLGGLRDGNSTIVLNIDIYIMLYARSALTLLAAARLRAGGVTRVSLLPGADLKSVVLWNVCGFKFFITLRETS